MDNTLKNLIAGVPGAAAIYGAVRPGRPRTRYSLEQLSAHLPGAVQEVRPFAAQSSGGSKLLLFATLHYWIEQASIVGLALRALGHDVTIAYLPYASWETEVNALDLARQDRYSQHVLAPLEGLVRARSLLRISASGRLPSALEGQVRRQSEYDCMYSLQNEEVDRDSRLFRLRITRNGAAARSALELLGTQRPDCVVVPNGLVTELGIVYHVAHYLGIPAVTYEFNDQREQIWLAQNDIVMFQNTDAIWSARRDQPLKRVERNRIAAFVQARRNGRVFGKGTRRWQDSAAVGGRTVRRELNLDNRPIVLLPTNVLGDSLTLGRHLFASSMAEWIEETVRYFLARPEVQLVIRVHPGERLIKGTSMLEVVKHVIPAGAGNIRLVPPTASINTYDILEIADLGLTYTTTVGLEMAMHGLPVIVAGDTHYRNRGFTLDPASWDEYFSILDRSLVDLHAWRLHPEDIELAWNYAYRFFFEYPFDFPWRLMHFWKDIEVWPLRRLLSEEGRQAFGRTFRHLGGDPIRW